MPDLWMMNYSLRKYHFTPIKERYFYNVTSARVLFKAKNHFLNEFIVF